MKLCQNLKYGRYLGKGAHMGGQGRDMSHCPPLENVENQKILAYCLL